MRRTLSWGAITVIVLAGLSLLAVEKRVRAQEIGPATASATPGGAAAGQSADIGPSAYLYRADRKPEENPPETAFLFAAAIGHKKEGVICGLLWEEPRAVNRVELVWPKDGTPPRAEDLVVRWMPHGNSASWWSRQGANPQTPAEKPKVSADGRSYTYTVNATMPAMAMDNLVVAMKEGVSPRGRLVVAPLVRVFTEETWRALDLEIQWGFQPGTEQKAFDGRLEVYNGVAEQVEALPGDGGTAMTRSHAWRSAPDATTRRGIRARVLFLGQTHNTPVWTEQAQLEDANRTIVTVRTCSGSFSFMPADLETGPILAPEYGFFVRRTGGSAWPRSQSPLASRTPQTLLSERLNAIAGTTKLLGWGSAETPWFGGNPGATAVSVASITMPARSVAMHPGSQDHVAVGWCSPIKGAVAVRARVEHAQVGSNGIEWQVLCATDAERKILAEGATEGAGRRKIPSAAEAKDLDAVLVEPGDTIPLIVGRKGVHLCDTTAVDLVISEVGGQGRVWNLNEDVVSSLHAGNPHADAQGHAAVWYFYKLSAPGPLIRPRPRLALASQAASGAEFIKELKARNLSTIRQQTRRHEEQSWDGAMRALHGDQSFPPYPKPELESPMKIDVPESRLNDAWRVGAWHLLRVCNKDKDGHYTIEDFPYGNCGLETEVIIYALDLMGMHAAAQDGLARWITQLGAPTGQFSDGDGCFMDPWHIAETPWSTQWALVEHYLLTGDKQWFSAWLPRIAKNADWIVRQRRGYLKNVPARDRLWMKGLLPPSNIWDAMIVRPWYSIDANSCFALRQFAEVIARIDPQASQTYRAEAEAYAKDILAAADESLVLSPVIRVRDGTYRSFLPPAPYMRGPASRHMPVSFGDPAHTAGLYADIIRGGVHFINPSRLLGPEDPRAQGMIDVLEDRLLSEHPRLPMRTGGYDPEKHWFSHAGWYYQCGIERTADVHLQWDDVPNFLRSFYNDYAVDIVVGPYTFDEHTTHGPPDKSFEEAVFLERLRNLLVMEDGQNLWLARATPRAWLKQGKKISVRSAPTHFGPVDYEIVSDADHGKITATVKMPSRGARNEVLLRLRHPTAAPIKSVTVNGKQWKEFDPDKEVVDLHGVQGAASVVASYQ